MDFDDQFELEHLFLNERKCRRCGVTKNLIDSFYVTHKNNTKPSSYSYECKNCTIKRIQQSRKKPLNLAKWEYPDW